jgi:hypothetical protein
MNRFLRTTLAAAVSVALLRTAGEIPGTRSALAAPPAPKTAAAGTALGCSVFRQLDLVTPAGTPAPVYLTVSADCTHAAALETAQVLSTGGKSWRNRSLVEIGIVVPNDATSGFATSLTAHSDASRTAQLATTRGTSGATMLVSYTLDFA